MKAELMRMALGAALACGATGALPAVAEDRMTPADRTFAGRGKYERLSLGYGIVRAGATKPFSVLHISDTHLTAAYDDEGEKKMKLRAGRTRTFGGHQEEALRDSLAYAKENVDYVVHTGDLIDWQSRANFDLVKKYFGPGMIGSLGNHEFSPDMWLSEPKERCDESFKDPSRKVLSETYPFDISLASQVVNGVNFVTLDDVYGTVTPGQVERFRAEAAKGLPIVLCMHVPFHTDWTWLAAQRYWSRAGTRFTWTRTPGPGGDYKRQLADPTTRDFIAYLKGEKLLRAILAGHEHITVRDQFSPTATEYVVGGNFLFHGEEILFT